MNSPRAKSRTRHLLALLLFSILIFLRVSLYDGEENYRIINVHESIETSEDAEKLLAVMQGLGIEHTVLHGIPESFLYYREGQEFDLTTVGENHELIFARMDESPDHFSVFCSLNPFDDSWSAELASCVEGGATGVKLYSGYSYSYQGDLSSDTHADFFAALEENELVLMYPLNAAYYRDDLEAVLSQNEDLKVVCSHYCLSSSNLERLSELMASNPNLYIDTSFGSDDFVEFGLLRLTSKHDEFAEFFTNYQDRILFGTDNVITSYEGKDTDYIMALFSDYTMVLQEEALFASNADGGTLYRGLDLDPKVLRKIYSQNWLDLMGS